MKNLLLKRIPQPLKEISNIPQSTRKARESSKESVIEISSEEEDNSAQAETLNHFKKDSFVILLGDVPSGCSKFSDIYRIDGKILMEKFEAFEESGVVKHRSTHHYLPLNTKKPNLYIPVKVISREHTKKTRIVQLDWT